MIAGWFSRLVHAIRAQQEDRAARDLTTVEQWRRVWAQPRQQGKVVRWPVMRRKVQARARRLA